MAGRFRAISSAAAIASNGCSFRAAAAGLIEQWTRGRRATWRDARLRAERAPIVLSGEEQARVSAAMARDSAQLLDRVLNIVSGAGGADV